VALATISNVTTEVASLPKIVWMIVWIIFDVVALLTDRNDRWTDDRFECRRQAIAHDFLVTWSVDDREVVLKQPVRSSMKTERAMS
jgi:hypothetical protein